MFPQKEPASLELDLDWKRGIVLLLALMFVFGILGAVVTPDGDGDAGQESEPIVLSPDHWTSIRLARKVHAETKALQLDVNRLLILLDCERPDPVAAMMMAQRLYATHRQGTSATGSARQALIDAAEITARAAVGELSYADAITAYNLTLVRIQTLTAGENATAATDRPGQTRQYHRIFVPLVLASAPSRME